MSHEQETLNLRLEIDHLHKKLHRKEHFLGDPTPPSSEGFDGSRDRTYRQRSRTPSESYSASSRLDKLDKHRKRRGESSSSRNMGNDAMSKVLRQISKLPLEN